MTARVIAVAGARGGSLVSSLAANVAGLLAGAGNATLLVDVDPADGVLTDLGVQAAERPGILRVRPGLDLLVGAALLAPVDRAAALERARRHYDVVLVDTSGAGADRGPALDGVDGVLVLTRSDRAAAGALLGELAARGRSGGPPTLGVVVVAVPPRPRSVWVRTRQVLSTQLDPTVPLFASSIRSAPAVSWWARDRGLLLRELVEQLDREILDPATVEDALGLARDYADVADELVARINPAG